jgi:hypothetical protein
VTDHSKDDLVSFLGYVLQKGLVNESTARGWNVAISKILDDLSPDEAADVRKIDVDSAFKKFANRSGGRFTPASLTEYRRRTQLAIQEFIAWKTDPSSYKPRGRSTGNGRKKDMERTVQRTPKQNTEESGGPLTPLSVSPSSQGLPLAFPIRSDFLAQVNEAKRLSAFIMTLAMDYEPGN